MKQFLLAFALGVCTCLLFIGLGATGLSAYYNIGPHNVLIFDDTYLQSIYVVRAPEETSQTQAQNLMEVQMIVLNLALSQRSELERVAALGYWASIMMCGMNPADKECLEKTLGAPKGQRL